MVRVGDLGAGADLGARAELELRVIGSGTCDRHERARGGRRLSSSAAQYKAEPL